MVKPAHRTGTVTDVLRSGARHLLAQAVEAEVEAHIAAHVHLFDEDGRRRLCCAMRDHNRRHRADR